MIKINELLFWKNPTDQYQSFVSHTVTCFQGFAVLQTRCNGKQPHRLVWGDRIRRPPAA